MAASFAFFVILGFPPQDQKKIVPVTGRPLEICADLAGESVEQGESEKVTFTQMLVKLY